VRGILDGTELLPGLAVDTELRWSLLWALVAVGAASDPEIDLELERDVTASGQRRAATARALLPTREAKAEAWQLATSETELPNAIVEAMIGGFYHTAQHALTEPFVQRYFDTIGEVWVQRSGEIARAIAGGLYPDAISDSAVAAADAFLADRSLPPALRRLVSEGRDDVQRALRARQRDASALPARG